MKQGAENWLQGQTWSHWNRQMNVKLQRCAYYVWTDTKVREWHVFLRDNQTAHPATQLRTQQWNETQTTHPATQFRTQQWNETKTTQTTHPAIQLRTQQWNETKTTQTTHPATQLRTQQWNETKTTRKLRPHTLHHKLELCNKLKILEDDENLFYNFNQDYDDKRKNKNNNKK